MNPENPQEFLALMAVYAPLGIIGAWRWGFWLLQELLAPSYQPIPVKKNQPNPSLSIVTPVYNEDPKLFHQALESWKQNNPAEIIAVIDTTDTACIKVFKDFQKQFTNSILVTTDVPGKRPALAEGSRKATGDIVALVDSDTVWGKDIKDILLAPFSDKKVGGVACRQAVINPRTPAERLFEARFSLRYLREYPFLMVTGNALTCLSGRTAVYRRTALLPVLDEMLNETFLWKKCISGEDKRLTSLVMRDGWKVRYQQNATVRTEGMSGLKQFFRQNLRWSRNSWRTDLRLLFSAWVWKREPMFGYHLFHRMTAPFTLLLGPIYFVAALYFGHWSIALILLIWWLVSRAIKLYPHLRERPKDLVIIPLFTAAQYHLAVLKIFALLTLDFQSWITRWDKSRLRQASHQLLPSRIATAAIILGVSFVVFQHASTSAQALTEKQERERIVYTSDPALLETAAWEVNFWETRKAHEVGTYLTRPQETPLSLRQKFNLPADSLSQLFPGRLATTPFFPGTEIKIPVSLLTTSYTAEIQSLSPATPVIAAYDPLTDIIRVKARNRIVTLTDIAKALPAEQQLLLQTAPGEWLLRSKLYISEGTLLVLDGKEVSWLKLGSSPEKYSYIRSQHAGILINNTRITSWDEEKNDFDREVKDGRAFIVAYGSGRMDVLNSEISHLGFPLDVAEHLQNFGGSYGLSWKLENNSFNKNLLTGNVIGNKVHHNYFGMYTFGTTQMHITDNEFYENIQYGIDPHDDSNNLLIENNFVHHNGNHGIIGSKRVNYSIIRHNRSTHNRLHGIMLDRNSDYNLVENNYTVSNVNGVAITDSRNNLIRQNTIVGNEFGVRSSHASSDNMLSDNAIQSNEKGVYLYDRSQRTILKDNSISSNVIGVHLKEAQANIIKNSLTPKENTLTLKTDDSSRKSNYIEEIK